jgi:hypothetical protein
MSINSKRIRIKAIRYNFTPEMMENIQEFTRVHQFDERKKYKEEWKCWINTKEIELKVSNEIIRLRDEGCTWEDEIIKEKMYKSSKFYYKKKMQTKTNDDDKIKTQEKYKGFTKQFLRSIDEYIHEKIKEKSRNIEDTMGLDVVPTKIYNEYCLNHKDEIKKEILRLREFHRKINGEVFLDKLKKTFSHRFYNVKQGINKV